MINLLFGLVGLLIGGLINLLADDLPARVSPQMPHCHRCGFRYGPGQWLVVGRRLAGESCPQCGLSVSKRGPVVEIGTALLFVFLPSLIAPTTDLIIYSFYIAILILVIVIDIEHRLILHAITFPTIVLALVAAIPLTDNSLRLALAGGLVGFVLFYLVYLLGTRFFGPGAFGFGDVTLATMMGVMLGFHRIFFALMLGILLGGIWSIVGLLTRKMTRRTYFAYGPFLAIAGIIMIIWGGILFNYYVGR